MKGLSQDFPVLTMAVRRVRHWGRPATLAIFLGLPATTRRSEQVRLTGLKQMAASAAL